MKNNYTTAEVASMSGVHKDTLLRWLRKGAVTEPSRDRRGWRIFSNDEADAIVRMAHANTPSTKEPINQHINSSFNENLSRLETIDWAFKGAKTNYLTHSLHPYPAKYIPQIPNALIQELSTVGETVGDIFCGSGTSILEALVLKRHTIGIDANPLSILIAKAKTTPLGRDDVLVLECLRESLVKLSEEISIHGADLFYDDLPFRSEGFRPVEKLTEFWFEPFVVEELAEIKKSIDGISKEFASNLAKAVFSSIIVTVSKQDSDTRYVRRVKKIRPGNTLMRFCSSLDKAIIQNNELADLIETRFRSDFYVADILNDPDVGQFDLMVCSPPYPNAYSYHLYHRSRMLWLGMDQQKFKTEEIGSHRKYSSKSRNRATAETFEQELSKIFVWLYDHLKNGRHACFVIGSSTINGERIDNAELLKKCGEANGFREVKRLPRRMDDTKKSFNPAIGKIKTEDISILQKV